MISLINERTGLIEQLIDARNPEALDKLKAKIEAQPKKVVGFDIETEDSGRHDGLNDFMQLNPKSTEYKNPRKLAFDINRTTVCGFSVYLQGDDTVYYVNMAHADVENRICPQKAHDFIQFLANSSFKAIHNYPFERTMCLKSLNIDLGWQYVCTLQMAVSAYNSDQYDIGKFKAPGLGGMAKCIPELKRVFAGVTNMKNLDTQQQEALNRIIGKDSTAEHSYNGYVKGLSYGYFLKKCTESIFGYKQTPFKDALLGRAHMGLVTGEEILHYGADDAYWCVRLYEWLLDFMQKTNASVLSTYFQQENQMPYIFSDCWARGWRVNYPAIYKRQEEERLMYIGEVKKLGKLLQNLEFGSQPSARLWQKQTKWYVGKEGLSFQKYRTKINHLKNGYAELIDAEDVRDVDWALLTAGAVPVPWAKAEDIQLKKKEWDQRGNFAHYMTQRTLLHDLCMLPFVYIKGDIKTDAEARGKMFELAERLGSEPELWLKEWNRYNQLTNLSPEVKQQLAEACCKEYPVETVKGILECLNQIGHIEQRIKLFITSYLQLTDPKTGRMYPIISSKLNTRRMAAENPNTMQLSKRGESTYIRGFFLPERDDHLLVGVDWSQVELVLIGEESKDPKFQQAFGQVPYDDLHLGAATSAIQVYYADFTPDMLTGIKSLTAEQLTEFSERYSKVLTNPVTKEPLEPYAVTKWWRTSAGKPSNFGYWYSGSLMTVQEKLGWTSDEMWAGTDNYRNTFMVAEQWRLMTIDQVKQWGFVEIFDGHRRVRYEGTDDWFYTFTGKWNAYNDPTLAMVGEHIARKIQRRAGNQAVNAKIQGGCAALAKRSIAKLWHILNDPNSKWDGVFIMPIHDELVFSVRYDQAIEFSKVILEVMCDHPDLVSWLKLDGTVSIGKTLEPYHPKKAPYGQIELDEAPVLEGYIPKELDGQKLPEEYRHNVVNYLMGQPASTVAEVAA